MPIGTRTRCVLLLVAIMIAVQAINTLTGNSLVHHGLVPRTLSGLQGLVFAPFLHGSIRHLVSNLLPFAVLSGLVITEGVRRYFTVAMLIALLGGSLVWLFGRASVHVGASGLIFGLWAYVLARGWYQRSLGSVMVALAVAVFYASLVFGFIPVPGVSFESHMAGAVAGVLVGWLIHSKTLLAKT